MRNAVTRHDLSDRVPSCPARRLDALDRLAWTLHPGTTAAPRLLGISLDITPQKQADADAQQLREELAHLSRVATLSALSGSLAHELNQPLASILSQCAARPALFAQQPPDLDEVRAILEDIVSDDRRASEVIHRLRAMLRRGECRASAGGRE